MEANYPVVRTAGTGKLKIPKPFATTNKIYFTFFRFFTAMKVLFGFILFFFFQFALGQNFYLTIKGASVRESSTIDSLPYNKKHQSVALLLEEQKRFETILTNQGFFDWLLLEQ